MAEGLGEVVREAIVAGASDAPIVDRFYCGTDFGLVAEPIVKQ